MSEKIRHIKNIDTKVLYDHPIILCDSSFIRCKNLPKIREVLKHNPGSMVVIPEEELQKGSSGHAKAEILASFAEVHAIIGSPEFSVKKIIDGEFGEFHQLGSITFSEKVVYDSNNEEPRIEIPTTNLQEDINFMKMTNDLISQSNCWWKPNGCIAVRDSNLIVSAVSTNPWCTDCKALSMNSSEVNLKKGERLNFCDSTHAERIVVAKAAKTG